MRREGGDIDKSRLCSGTVGCTKTDKMMEKLLEDSIGEEGGEGIDEENRLHGQVDPWLV